MPNLIQIPLILYDYCDYDDDNGDDHSFDCHTMNCWRRLRCWHSNCHMNVNNDDYDCDWLHWCHHSN